jgi:hypothetical protein
MQPCYPSGSVFLCSITIWQMAAVQAGKINTTHKLSRFCDRNCQKTRHSMHMAYSQPVAGPRIGRRRRCRQSTLVQEHLQVWTPRKASPKTRPLPRVPWHQSMARAAGAPAETAAAAGGEAEGG